MLPSGDQFGHESSTPGLLVMSTTLLPNESIRWMSAEGSVRRLLKAIVVPSGDQNGSESSAGLLASGVRPVPSTLILYTSKLRPGMLRWKTIWEPSGCHAPLVA